MKSIDPGNEPPWRSGGGPRPAGRESPERDGKRPLILVVEDDPHDWEIYGKILWYNGFDVMYSGNGADGLELAQRHRPDLLLVDLVLPRMDGLELCRRCKEDESLVDVPVVLLTARSEAKYGERARAAGCVEYLEKPQSPTEVLHCVERIVGRPPASGEGRPPRLSELH